MWFRNIVGWALGLIIVVPLGIVLFLDLLDLILGKKKDKNK